MNNDILYIITKYIEESPNIHLNTAIQSKENIIRKIDKNIKVLNKWMQRRTDYSELKRVNIIKEFDIRTIIKKLEKIKIRDGWYYDGIFVNRVSSRLVGVGKKIDFGLKRMILKRQLERIYQ